MRPLVSADNALCTSLDSYPDEDVVVHETAVAAFKTEWFGHIELTSTCHRDPTARNWNATVG
ncbi:MAG: hypothetical protein F4153_06355 [Acidimicrobiia bacterium]|nr:hypothetical protein [Acidimicrobiia bacterium]